MLDHNTPIVNDRRPRAQRPEKPPYITMWEPVVEAGRDLARHGLCQGVRARYFNQETGEYEEVDVLRITDATKMPVHSSDDYEEAVYVFIRRDDGEELHVQASLICKKGKDGEEPKPEYIFTPRASV